MLSDELVKVIHKELNSLNDRIENHRNDIKYALDEINQLQSTYEKLQQELINNDPTENQQHELDLSVEKEEDEETRPVNKGKWAKTLKDPVMTKDGIRCSGAIAVHKKSNTPTKSALEKAMKMEKGHLVWTLPKLAGKRVGGRSPYSLSITQFEGNTYPTWEISCIWHWNQIPEKVRFKDGNPNNVHIDNIIPIGSGFHRLGKGILKSEENQKEEYTNENRI